MSNYDLSSPLAIAAAAREIEAERWKLREEGFQTGEDATSRTAYLYAYQQALEDCAKQLEEYRNLVDIVLNYLGDHHDSSELYKMFHEDMELSNEEIEFLGFDLPQLYNDIDISEDNGSTFVIVNGIEVDLSNYLTDKTLIQKLMKDEAFKSDVSSQFEKAFSMADDGVSGDGVLDDVVESAIRMRLLFYKDYHQPQWFDTLDAKIGAAESRTNRPNPSSKEMTRDV